MEDLTRTYAHNGTPRSGLVCHAAQPKCAIVLLHPGVSSGAAMATTGKWLEYSDISIFAPDALGVDATKPAHPYKNPSAWSTQEPPVAHRTVPDLEFVDQALEEFLQALPPDVPVYLVGHSNGVAFGFRLLTEGRHKARFAAAAFHAGEWLGDFSTLTIPILLMAGRSDNMRPFAGSARVVTPWFTLSPPPAFTIVKRCISALGSTGHPNEIVAQPEATIIRWNDGAAPLEFAILHGQGHNWPAGPMPAQSPEMDAIAGPNNDRLDATAMALDFFERVAR